MRFPATRGRPTVYRPLFVLFAVLPMGFGLGCASPGPPLPPSLYLPRIVDDLAAARVGDMVELRWTTPSRTTDDLDIKGPLEAEICREDRPGLSRQATPCVSVTRISVHPGPSQAASPLPADLTREPARLLGYRIRIFNANGRSAGPSVRAFSASGAAPPAIERLRATSARSGVMLEWKPSAASFPVDLDRRLIAVAAPVASRRASDAAADSRLLNPAPAPTAEVHLQVRNQGADAGGTLDRSAQKGATYRYTAQRVRTVTLSGHTLEVRGTSSPAVTVTLRDTFPPLVPAGLAAIPDSGSHSIDLSWEPVADSDTAGYIVYRQEVGPAGAPAGGPIRLNAAPVVGPAYNDRTAVPGQSYLYRVAAIDNAGNESAPSASVEETLPEP